MTANATTDLYRYYDAEGQLLYVGISFSAVARASQHRSEKGWWCEVANMTVEHHPTRAAAELAEREAIKTERPIHNVTHNQPTRSVTATKPVHRVFAVGKCFAFGMPDGRCPVGYIAEYWESDGVYSRPELVVELYSWLHGTFGHATEVIEVTGGMQVLQAEWEMVDGVRMFDMDPLAAFQTKWRAEHEA